MSSLEKETQEIMAVAIEILVNTKASLEKIEFSERLKSKSYKLGKVCHCDCGVAQEKSPAFKESEDHIIMEKLAGSSDF